MCRLIAQLNKHADVAVYDDHLSIVCGLVALSRVTKLLHDNNLMYTCVSVNPVKLIVERKQ